MHVAQRAGHVNGKLRPIVRGVERLLDGGSGPLDDNACVLAPVFQIRTGSRHGRQERQEKYQCLCIKGNIHR